MSSQYVKCGAMLTCCCKAKAMQFAFATVNPWLSLLVKYPQRTWRNGVHYNQERQITDMVDQQTYNNTWHKYAQANPYLK
jgi:hypothetical protein